MAPKLFSYAFFLGAASLVSKALAQTRTATTTRYWDCSGGSCGCSYVRTGLSGSEPSMCHSNAMFAAPSNNPYGAKFYGTAAISASLGGGDWMSSGCGKCWKVTGTSNVPGFSGVSTTLVLKGTNFCPDANPMCARGPHFDIAAPGFDVLEFSLSNTCPQREPDEIAGECLIVFHEDGRAACLSWSTRRFLQRTNLTIQPFLCILGFRFHVMRDVADKGWRRQ
jgi:hypothetical protein